MHRLDRHCLAHHRLQRTWPRHRRQCQRAHWRRLFHHADRHTLRNIGGRRHTADGTRRHPSRPAQPVFGMALPSGPLRHATGSRCRTARARAVRRQPPLPAPRHPALPLTDHALRRRHQALRRLRHFWLAGAVDRSNDRSRRTQGLPARQSWPAGRRERSRRDTGAGLRTRRPLQAIRASQCC